MLNINQNGVRPGARKMAQFLKAFQLTKTPALYSDEETSSWDKLAYVKIFNPCGGQTWFITEFSEVAPDGVPNLAYGYVVGMGCDEFGYISIEELAEVRGPLGIGLEIDVHFTPKNLREAVHGVNGRLS